MAAVSKADGFLVQQQNAYPPKQGDLLTEDLKMINNIANEKLSETTKINKLDEIESTISLLKTELQDWENEMKEFEQKRPFDHEKFQALLPLPYRILGELGKIELQLKKI